MSSAGASSNWYPRYRIYLFGGDSILCSDLFEVHRLLLDLPRHGKCVVDVSYASEWWPAGHPAQLPLDITVLTDTVDKDISY